MAAAGTSSRAPWIGGCYAAQPMQDEAEITINGIKLSDAESMTLRVAVDTLANVLAEGAEAETDGVELAERYMTALTRIQTLLETRAPRTQ